MEVTPPGAGNALHATLLVANSAFWSALMIVAVRAPHTGLIWLMGPILCTIASFGETTCGKRALAAAADFITFGMLQFLFTALSPMVLPAVLFCPAAIRIAAFRRSGNRAGAVFCASMMNITENDLAEAGELLVTVAVLAAIVPLTSLMLEKFLLRRTTGSRLVPAAPPLDGTAILRRSAAGTAALALMYALNWHFGHWIPLTVALLYLKSGDETTMLRFAELRSLAATPGFALGLLSLATAAYIDYRLDYFAALWLVLAFHYSFRRREYFGFSIMYMVVCCMLNDLLLERSPLFANGWELFFQSVLGTLIGCAIVAAAEAALPAGKTQRPAQMPPIPRP